MKTYLLSTVGVLTFFLLLTIFGLQVNKIDCQLENQACPVSLTKELTNQLKKERMVFNDLKTKIATNQLIFGHYLVKDTQKIWPNKLRIQLEPDKVVYQIKTDTETTALSSSQVASQIEKPLGDILVIKADSQLKEQILKDKTLHQKLTLFNQALLDAGLKNAQMSFEDKNLAGISLNDQQLIILVDLEKPQPLAGLKLILGSDEFLNLNKSEKTKVIDLRFKLPVLYLR